MDFIKIEVNNTPKYQQIINCICRAIENGIIKKNDKIPSLNKVMKQFSLSQDTVMTAYNQLKTRGIISSAVGKGYYVSGESTYTKYKVFVLFDNLSLYKDDLFQAIEKKFKDKGEVEIYFHHNNIKLCKKLIDDANGNYTSYIIMPINDKKLDDFIIKTLPPKSVYLIDRGSDKLRKKYPFVGQNFKRDVKQSLKTGLKQIGKYRCIQFINSSAKSHILQIEAGVKEFAKTQNFQYKTHIDISNVEPETGDLFLVIRDHDLVILIEKAQIKGLLVGKDIGIISYNETHLKRVISCGISTISTDFELMGNTISEMIINKERKRIYNKAKLIIRNSILL